MQRLGSFKEISNPTQTQRDKLKIDFNLLFFKVHVFHNVIMWIGCVGDIFFHPNKFPF